MNKVHYLVFSAVLPCGIDAALPYGIEAVLI